MAKFTIDAGTFARNALAVHAAGMMAYQKEHHLAGGQLRCQYMYEDGCRCAIGAGLDEGDAQAIQYATGTKPEYSGGLTVGGLFDHDFLEVTSPKITYTKMMSILGSIQEAHDDMLRAMEVRPELEGKILTLLTQLADQHPVEG